MSKPFLFSGTIQNCYDSHVHWPSTGHWARRLSLHQLRSQEDFNNLQPIDDHFEGPWLIGYGWDQNTFTDLQLNRTALDEKFPNTPVCFTRVDGHAIWVNTLALQTTGLFQQNIHAEAGGEIVLDQSGWPTGVLIDQALSLVKKHIPRMSPQSLKKDLYAGQKAFHKAGFTHIRDLTCDELQWQMVVEMQKDNHLRLAVSEYFSEYHPENFQRTLQLALDAKKSASGLLRVCGMKVFYDGALGSEGAYLSRPYLTKSPSHPQACGLRLIQPQQLREMFEACRQNNLIFSIHVIGDEAAHEVISIASDLKKTNRLGPFELEHLELLRPETLALLRGLPVTVYFQPCHWLSDKRWLESKIGDLINTAFRWRDLEDNRVPFYFGSDSPVEESSLNRNLQALADAAQHSIPAPQKSWALYHSHPDTGWPGQTATTFIDGEPSQVLWCGEKLLQ